MAVIGTFGSFTTARLGIYASQASLQVTGNNIANINTKGYTRQRADLISLYSTGTAKYANPMSVDIGYGVLVDRTTQLRDPYLDIRYRNENTKLGAANATLSGLVNISQTLDEVNQGTSKNGRIEDCLMNFKSMLEGLSKQVGSEEQDGLVRESAKSLTTFFNTAAKKLQEDWKLQKDELEDTVKTVNECLTNIRDLNEQIRKQGIYGDMALELRDHRNLEIDKLSQYIGIDVEYSMERIDQYTEVEKLTIYLKDTQDPRSEDPNVPYPSKIKLVDGLYAGQFSFSTEEVNPKYQADEKKLPALNPQYNPNVTDKTDPAFGKYLDETGKGTNDIDKANMILMNPDFQTGKVALNPKYDPDDPTTGGKYLCENGTTDDVNLAIRVKTNPNYSKSVPMKNPNYDSKKAVDDPETFGKYLTADGKGTNTDKDAVLVMPNPDAKDDDPSTWYFDGENKAILFNADKKPTANVTPVGRYLKADGTSTNDVTQAESIDRYLDADGNPTNDLKKAALASRQYLTDPKLIGVDGMGATTNDPSKAAKVDPNKFLLQVDRLEDKFGRPLNKGKETESVTIPLDDNDLSGALQSMRELLTEEGEFASKDDVGLTGDDAIRNYLEKLTGEDGKPLYTPDEIDDILKDTTPDGPKAQAKKMLERAADNNAAIKMGIPYYQKRLDLLAQKFAQIFNEANQMPASTVYTTDVANNPNQFLNKDASTVFTKDDGSKISIEVDDVTIEVEVLDADGKQVLDDKGQPVKERIPLDSPRARDALKERIKEEHKNTTPPTDPPTGEALEKAVDEKIQNAADCLELLREQGQLKKEYGYYDGGVLFSNNGNSNDPTGITAENITISNSWAARTVRVLNSTLADYPVDPTKPDGPWVEHSSDNTNINHMISMFEKKLDYSASEIEPDAAKGGQTFFQGSFQEMFTNMGATLGSQTNTMDGIAYNYEVLTLNIDNSRLSISGVDLNDEATSMMQFQKSYQAACRLLTTIDSMLDTLINGTLR